ncbi:hypothetical protein ON010_g17036 [Phytophthora cinnamomi]|nr:hypothetical protein ON010_g17036 [Phytophthora cinnamomi]
MRGGFSWLPPGGLLLQGKILGAGIQPGMYSHVPVPPAQRLWSFHHPVFVRAQQEGGEGGFPGEASVGPWTFDIDQERRYHRYSAAPQHDQVSRRAVRGPQVVPEKLHWAPLHLDIKRDKWSLKAMTADKED